MLRLVLKTRLNRFRIASLLVGTLALEASAVKVDSILNLYSLYSTDRTVLNANFQTFKGSGKVGSNKTVTNLDPQDMQHGNGVFGWDVTAGDSLILDGSYAGTALRPILAGTLAIDANGATFDTMKYTRAMIDGSGMGGHNNNYKGGLLGAVGSSITWRGWNNKVGPSGTTVFPQGATPTFALPADGGNLSYTGPALPQPPTSLVLPDTAIDFATYDWSKCPDVTTPGIPNKGTNVHIPAGCYGKITINNLDTLTIDEGTYVVRDMSMLQSGGNASLLANQPKGRRTLLICANSWQQGNGSATIVKDSKGNDSMASATMNIRPSNEAMGQMMILYKGTQPMTIGTGTHITATISAPNADLNLRDKTALYGQAFAKRLFIRTDFNANLGQYIPYYDVPPKVTITQLSATVREPDTLATGKPDTVVAKFLLEMDHVNGIPVTIWYHTRMIGPPDSPGVALEGADYVDVPKGSTRIAVNTLSDTIRIKVLGNVWYEGDRKFHVVIDSIWNGEIDPMTKVGVGTILENDLPPVFRIEDGSTTEGDPLRMRVHLVQVPSKGGQSVASASARWVRYRWRVVPKNPALIPAWDTAFKQWRTDSLLPRTSDTVVSIPTFADGVYQQAETLFVQIDWVYGATTLIDSGARVLATGIILDSDGPPVLSVTDTSVLEGHDSTTISRVRVRILSSATGKPARLARPLSFNWSTSDLTAKSGKDYRGASGTVSFTRFGASDTLLPVRILGDRRHDTARVFRLALSNAVGASLTGTWAKASGDVTIHDDDLAPVVTAQTIVHARSVRDTVWRFAISLSDSSRTQSIFRWRTQDGTAKAGFDFVGDSGTISMRPQQRDTFVDVVVKGLSVWHSDRAFTLDLVPVSDISRANDGTGVIQAAVAAPTIRLQPANVQEGKSGDTAILKIPYILVDGSGNPTTSLDTAAFDWSTSAGSALDAPDAVFGLTDFVKVVSAHAVLAAGKSGDTIRVKVLGNGLDQDDRAFTATAVPTYGLTSGSSATLTILDDDQAPRVVVDSVVRSRDGTASVPFPFVVRLVGASGKDTVSGKSISFAWSTRDGSATVAQGDYAQVVSRSEVLAPNTSRRTLTVTVLPDSRYAPDLDFFVDLQKLTNVVRVADDSVGRGLIVCGVDAPRVRVVGGTTNEGKDGDTTLLPFRIDLVDATGASMGTRVAIPFTWSTADSTAKQPDDYVKVTDAPGTIPAYSTGTRVFVAVPGHSRHNVPSRYLKAAVAPQAGLYTPQGSVLTGVGTIRNARAAPKATVNSVTVQEPAKGSVAVALFTVKLNERSALESNIRFSLEDSSALAGTNYQLFGNGSRDTLVRVAPGATTVTVPVRVVADDIFDTARVFVVRLSRVDAHANPSTVPGYGRIVNSDEPPTATITDTVWVRERSVGSNTALFTVTLSRRSAFPVRIPFATADGTGKAGDNYTATSGTLAFVPRGSLNLDIPVLVHNDGIFTNTPLSFYVDLSKGTDSVRIPDPRGVGMVMEYNNAPELFGDTLRAPKRDTIVDFTLHLTQPMLQDDTVAFAMVDGTARDGRDYVATSGRLALRAGQTEFQVPVRILKPVNWYKNPRTFSLRLSGTDTVTIVTPSVPAFIRDMDPPPAVDISDADTVVEGEASIFRLTLPGPSDDTIKVVVATRDVTAKSGVNYAGIARDTVMFLPERTSLTLPVATLEDSLFDTLLTYQARLLDVLDDFAVLGDSVGDAWISESGPTPWVVWAKTLDTVREDVRPDSVSFPVRLSRKVAFPFTLPVRLDTAFVPELNRARSSNFRLIDPVVRFPAATEQVDWWIRILDDGISTENKRLPMVVQPARWVDVGDDSLATLVIRDTDSLPRLSFVDSLVVIRQTDTVIHLRVALRPASGRVVDAPYAVSGTARYGLEHLLRDGRTPGYQPGDTLKSIGIQIVDDHRYGPDRRLVVRLGETESATLGLDSAVVVIRESSARPVVEFDTARMTVRDNAGRVDVRIVQSIVSDSVTTASVRLDSLSKRIKGIGLAPDTVVAVKLDTGSVAFVFSFAIHNDGKVGPDRVLRLHLSDVVSAAAGADSVLEITILNTNLPPVVLITSPSHKPSQPQDSLTGSREMLVKWTLKQGRDGAYGPAVPQEDTTFTLEEGWNILRRSFTDSAGNFGSDSVRVLADFTPPSVQVYKIIVPDPTDSTRSLDVPGKSVATRFGKDTVCYWVRDSAKGPDGNWRVKVDSFKVAVDLRGDSTFRIPVQSCDAVGNCGRDTGVISLKQSRPKIEILDPHPLDTVSSGIGPVTWSTTDAGETWTTRDQESFPVPGWHDITRCAVDSVGNKGCATVTVFVKPVEAERSWFVDTDGDGRVDAAIVELDARWGTGPFPSFDFKLGDEVREGQKPDSSKPWATMGSRGTPLRDSSGKLVLGAKGDTIWAAAGQILYGTDGKPRVVDGFPQTTILGDTLYDADGKAIRDSLGRLLFKVPGPGMVDSTRLLVPIKPPFAYGVTGFDQDQEATLRASVVFRDSKGRDSLVKVVDDFKVGDKVAPVILSATLVRTELYDGLDSLVVVPSEPLWPVGDWLEIKKDGKWVVIPPESLSINKYGHLVIVLPPGDSVSPRPGLEIRFRGGVRDELGNKVDVNNRKWTAKVEGDPRPPLVDVVVPKPVVEISSAERDRRGPGGIVIRASDSHSKATAESFTWWKPGSGYSRSGDDQTKSICPSPEFCNGPILYMNRPAKLLVYVYDNAGTFVMKFEQSFTDDDLDASNPNALVPDKLDRYRIQLAWNHRDVRGDLVASGIYLWRIVSYVKEKGRPTPVMTNKLYKIGVKIHHPEGFW